MRRTVRQKEIYADDATEGIGLLLRLRFPWLLAGMVGGGIATVLVSRFEAVLLQYISLAFFLPIIVYMSDAVGTQTETIYIRNLGRKHVKTPIYFAKEFEIGVLLGLVFGVLLGLFAYLWLGAVETALVVGFAMFATVAVAPVIALAVSSVFYREHTDPALGAGPFSTVIQDITSLLIYFLIASVILFS